MTLLNGSQQIIVTDTQVKLIGEDKSTICVGKTIGECIHKLLMLLSQEAVQQLQKI